MIYIRIHYLHFDAQYTKHYPLFDFKSLIILALPLLEKIVELFGKKCTKKFSFLFEDCCEFIFMKKGGIK